MHGRKMLSDSVGLLMFFSDYFLLGWLLGGENGKKHTYCIDVRACVCVFTLNEQSAGGGECIYGNALVPSCHCVEEDGCHKRGDHLTSAAPQLRGVKMVLEPQQNLP